MFKLKNLPLWIRFLFSSRFPVILMMILLGGSGTLSAAKASGGLSGGGTASSVSQTAEEIAQLFEDLQAANLQEDIDEFMRYYADDFPDVQQKRQSTLKNWQKYDFVSLDHFIYDLQVKKDKATADVGWEIAILEEGQTSPRLIEMTHHVSLVKTAIGWQITALK